MLSGTPTEKHIGDEEETQRDIVLQSAQPQVFSQSQNLRVSDICAVQMRDQVQHC